MFLADDWQSFAVLDCGDGEKLERWGDIVLRRPDPQAIWAHDSSIALWKNADAHYLRNPSGGGAWQFHQKFAESWQISWRNLQFIVRPTGFKHTGLFPEQAANWAYMMSLIASAKRPIKVLNLFGYTGGATVACAAAGASVCHVDAAKGMVAWAKDNLSASDLADKPVRFIVDDCVQFVRREARRGNTYDGILMDPPSYGRGPSGEVWKLEDALPQLLAECVNILSDHPLFFLVNSYTTGLQPAVLHNLLKVTVGRKFGGTVQADELGIPVERGGLVLPCGATGRWQP